MSTSENPKSQIPNPKPKNWYSSWFDTPYYHILYKDRNYREAQIFMDNLTHYLNLPEKAKVLDLACGKGRHAIYLNKLGFDVVGADLSENSIAEATKNANDTLHFVVHDKREVFAEKFDAIFNLFTSFGYFENREDDIKTLMAIKESLSEYGFAVIDFMNSQNVIDNLIPEETKEVDGITFNIKRFIIDGYIIKEIDFEAEGKKFHFTEKVRAYNLEDFQNMMNETGIYLLDTFGDYKLKKFHKNTSERLIMIFK
ncbi:class I SAM-dependent methyltransferase [Flavobacterium paronense]|uniref:Class I SAM-dependent methyltransferase n=1 Tax=Flavobacterium paronense TaxID=1392775 RepID=A0ABV5GH00_9FLAO|nr:class I SAM-dependent methyltransferase [Flavobacterium paronense]MDN3677226.1 class I SAM-dependent methyltransferase [Flavobacterium paronense]